MDYYTAHKINENWGSKYCVHPSVEKMYYSGAFLISYVCTVCGKELTICQKLELDEQRKHNHK